MSAVSSGFPARYGRALRGTLLASSILATAPVAFGQDAAESGQLEEITVTAQKRTENLQTVPISIQAFSGKKLEQYNATEFGDYVKFLPSVTYQTLAPNQTNIYIRGVASGNDGNHSGPLPSVGVYLDETPITTIQGAIDVHMYDIDRVEALAGPQGTLYGASSEAGTIRIITNKPDLDKFSAGYQVEINQVDHGGVGNVVESFVNVPISDQVAIRLVGFEEGDAGYIDNVHGSLTFPSSGITIDNASKVKNDYNGVQTYGGRGAVKVALDDDWSVLGSVMGQQQRSTGVFGYEPNVGDLEVIHFQNEGNYDRWYQAALTIQGKISDFDVVYSGGYFNRWLNSQSDYTDYSFFYDTVFGSGAYITNSAGKEINPSQHITGTDKFAKQSHEFRISSPTDDRFRIIAGAFYEHQTHDIRQQYTIDGFDPHYSVTGLPGTIWLTQQVRTDRDAAIFGQGSFDITDQLSVTGGVRVFDARNSLFGFYGFSENFSSHTGEANCELPRVKFQGAPCVDLNKVGEEVGTTYKANLTYKFDEDRLVYFTASSGFRPGGANRNGNLAPYTSDTLYNYEIGWKTSWDNKQFRWNGALYWENWDDFQFAFLGPNSLTEIANAGSATIKGLESDVSWAVDSHWLLSGAGSLTDARLTTNYCGYSDPTTNQPVTNCVQPQAPSGTQLPVTPFLKANVTARYEFSLSDSIDAFTQGSVVFQGRSTSDLRTLCNITEGPLAGHINSCRSDLGMQQAYATVDLSAGFTYEDMSASLFIKNAFDERGQVYRYAECPADVCGRGAPAKGQPGNVYIVPTQPLTVGVKFSQNF